MRVVHILRKYDPSEWGGTESALHLLLDEMRGCGTESVVYAPRLEREPASDPLAAVGVEVKRFRACLPVWGLPAERRRQLVAVGGNLCSFELPRALQREQEAKLIHTHALGRLGGVALTVARRRGVPLVVTIHGGAMDLPEALQRNLQGSGPKGWEWGKLFGLVYQSRHLLERADAILTCNPREAELLRKRYPDRRVLVHPHGVPRERYLVNHRPAGRRVLADRPGELILCLGRIDAVKNQRWLVEQAPELLRRRPQARLVLVGACTDAAYGVELNRLIRELGLVDRVVLTGGLPPGDPRLVGLLQEAAALVIPSVSETFGLVILEAWAAGTPVISSRTSGASSLIRHGEDGWLFDLGRPEDFQEQVERTLGSPALAAQLSAGGRRRVATEYDSKVLADRMQNLYDELIAEKRWEAAGARVAVA